MTCEFGSQCCSTRNRTQVPVQEPHFHGLVMNSRAFGLDIDLDCVDAFWGHAYARYREENICLISLSSLLLPHIPIKWHPHPHPNAPTVFAMLVWVWYLSSEHFHCSKSFILSVWCGMPEGGTHWRACLTLTFEVILVLLISACLKFSFF